MKINNYTLLLATATLAGLFLSGCSYLKEDLLQTAIKGKQEVPVNNFEENYENKNFPVFASLEELIGSLTSQLVQKHKVEDSKVIMTSFVDLDNFEVTNSFGRLLSESFFDDLYVGGLKLIDYRGKSSVSVNEKGEFHLTRDISLLKDEIVGADYILVGTFTQYTYKNSVLVNTRIIDIQTGQLYSSAKGIYKPHRCTRFEFCKQETKKPLLNKIDLKTKEEDIQIDINIKADR